MDRCFIGMWFDFFKKPNNAIQTKSKHMIHKIYANKLKYLTSNNIHWSCSTKRSHHMFLYIVRVSSKFIASNKIHLNKLFHKNLIVFEHVFSKTYNIQQNPFKQVVPQKGLLFLNMCFPKILNRHGLTSNKNHLCAERGLTKMFLSMFRTVATHIYEPSRAKHLQTIYLQHQYHHTHRSV